MKRPDSRFRVRAIIEAFRARPGASLAAGALLPFGLAPYDLWPLTLVSAVGLYWVLTREGARPLRDGWFFGVGKYGLGASWIYVSIHEYGNAAPPLAAFLVAVFVAGMALFSAAAAWLFVRFRPTNATVVAIWFATVWVLLEWLLTWFLTGFPWLFAGYAMLDTPLEALAPAGRGAVGEFCRRPHRCVSGRLAEVDIVGRGRVAVDRRLARRRRCLDRVGSSASGRAGAGATFPRRSSGSPMPE